MVTNLLIIQEIQMIRIDHLQKGKAIIAVVRGMMMIVLHQKLMIAILIVERMEGRDRGQSRNLMSINYQIHTNYPPVEITSMRVMLLVELMISILIVVEMKGRINTGYLNTNIMTGVNLQEVTMILIIVIEVSSRCQIEVRHLVENIMMIDLYLLQ